MRTSSTSTAEHEHEHEWRAESEPMAERRSVFFEWQLNSRCSPIRGDSSAPDNEI